MTLTEQIQVYRYTKADDGFGGYVPAAPVLLSAAPTWASIEELSGDDLVLNERFTTQKTYRITCRWRDDFNWQRNTFIVSRFGNLDVTGIRESVRKRWIEIDATYIEGVDDTGSGTPTIVGELTTLYYTVPSDTATVTLSAINGKTVYLVFRDGIEKKVVASNPQVNEVAIIGSTLSLVSGDIFFAGERLTVLYK